MDSQHVQSESLKVGEVQRAEMGNVLEALAINQLELAENLLARISKRILVEELDRHESNSLVQYPEPKRVLKREFSQSDCRLFLVSSRRIIGKFDEPWLPAHLEVRCRSLGDEIGLNFTGVGRAWLVDALETKISPRGGGVFEFSWKQKFAIG